jgi:hypothetical protein
MFLLVLVRAVVLLQELVDVGVRLFVGVHGRPLMKYKCEIIELRLG